ncbi:MAG TPA: outer membrane lipoprotein-sorting protein [Chthonomonadales bacterium]|nr:outer membrane lipoprotein-sorting protein [Chthonomonadales bacterium]
MHRGKCARYRSLSRYVLVSLTLWLAASVSAGASTAPSTNLADYVCPKLDDFTAIMHIDRYDDNAGRKINKDFGDIYKLKGDIRVSYKEEDRLRLDAHIGAARAIYIVNGPHQYVRVPSFGIKTTSYLGDTPGKQKTLLDVGLISAGYLDLAEGQYIGSRPVDGVMCSVFRLQYKNRKFDTSHRIIWVDPATRVVLKREEYNQSGKLNATYYYEKPFLAAPGIWFPSRIEAVNSEGQVAGVTDYRSVKVNIGLPDSLFSS